MVLSLSIFLDYSAISTLERATLKIFCSCFNFCQKNIKRKLKYVPEVEMHFVHFVPSLAFVIMFIAYIYCFLFFHGACNIYYCSIFIFSYSFQILLSISQTHLFIIATHNFQGNYITIYHDPEEWIYLHVRLLFHRTNVNKILSFQILVLSYFKKKL